MKRPERRTCQQPDRDAPGLTCGYPLPCPYHTAVLDLQGNAHVPAAIPPKAAYRLGQVSEALRDRRKGRSA